MPKSIGDMSIEELEAAAARERAMRGRQSSAPSRFMPIQTEFDRKWNAEMARKEEERRARGTMPTTVVDSRTGASPGKNIYGRTPEEEKAYREDLARRQGGAPAQPASSAQPAASGDAFGDFRAQQQAENRRRIADGYRQAAQESANGIRATAREQKAARDAMRMNQNKAAYALWSALDGTPEGDEILDGSVDSFMRLYNETMGESGSSVTGYKKFMRRGADGKNEAYLRFTIKGADGTERTKDYGRTELMEGLMRHGVPKEAFADKPAQGDADDGKKNLPQDAFDPKFFAMLSPSGKKKYAAMHEMEFDEADFAQEPAPAAAPAAPDPAETKRQENWTAAYNKYFDEFRAANPKWTPDQVKAEATKWADSQYGASATPASSQPVDTPADVADALAEADQKRQQQQQSPESQRQAAAPDGGNQNPNPDQHADQRDSAANNPDPDDENRGVFAALKKQQRLSDEFLAELNQGYEQRSLDHTVVGGVLGGWERAEIKARDIQRALKGFAPDDSKSGNGLIDPQNKIGAGKLAGMTYDDAQEFLRQFDVMKGWREEGKYDPEAGLAVADPVFRDSKLAAKVRYRLGGDKGARVTKSNGRVYVSEPGVPSRGATKMLESLGAPYNRESDANVFPSVDAYMKAVKRLGVKPEDLPPWAKDLLEQEEKKAAKK